MNFDKFIYFHRLFRNGILVYGVVYKDCEQPPTILHGKALLVISDDGTEVSAAYSCDAGFHLHGNPQMGCNLDTDEWLGDLPVCKLGKPLWSIEIPQILIVLQI